MKPIDKQLVKRVKEMISDGKSVRYIACELGLGKSTVGRIRKHLPEPLETPKSGRPSKLSPRDKHEIGKWIRSRKVTTAKQACIKLNQTREKSNSVSPNTVRKAIRDVGLLAKKKVPKPKLTKKHIRYRKKFVDKYKDWTVDDYKRIVWSDETKINRFNSDGLQWVYVDANNNQIADRVQPKTKFGGGGIMVWGCMTWAGVGKLTKIDGTMNALQYTQILESSLMPTLDALSILPEFPDKENLIFQQDNDPKHTANLTKSWFANHGIKPMEWPANSPDLNPIEHLWSILKRKLAEYEEAPKGCLELWERAKREWSKISPETCQNLIRSMPSRLEAVKKAKGRQTKY